MRRLLTIAAILLTASLSAQEAPAGKEKNHQHALEFTTGYPGIFMLFEYGLGIEGFEGQRANRHFQHGLNIGYTFSWGKRWELNTLLNLHLTRYELYQYPKLEGSNGYDWDAEPTMIPGQSQAKQQINNSNYRLLYISYCRIGIREVMISLL